jgi:hypothetical protein
MAAVEEQDQLAGARAKRDVVAGAEAYVARGAQQPNLAKPGAHHLGSPVGGAVVHDHDLVRATRRCGGQ